MTTYLDTMGLYRIVASFLITFVHAELCLGFNFNCHSEKVSWSEAFDRCIKSGGNLATISSLEQNDQVLDQCVHIGDFWIDSNISLDVSQFARYSDESSTPRHLALTESETFCTYLSMDYGYWFKTSCKSKKGYVCKQDEPIPLKRKLDTSKPNILVFVADDLGYGDLKSFDTNSKIPTPNLDRLASDGTVFLDAHSSSGICSPSRHALLTGRYHWRSNIFDHLESYGQSSIDTTRLTIPKMLKESGYHTALIGKWHLGWDWNAIKKKGKKSKYPNDFYWNKRIPGGPIERGGYDYYFGEDVINYPPYCWFENETVYGEIPNSYFGVERFQNFRQKEGKMHHSPGPMVDGWNFYDIMPTLVDKAVKYLKSQTVPWFLHFSFPSPHMPIIPNDKFDGKSGAGPYGDFVVELDDAVGQIINAIKTTQRENTLIIFTSDNGPETIQNLAYKRALEYDHWSAAPLRGGKRDLYEGGHRVPFIVSWPNQVPKGKVSNAIISQVDIFATLASVVEYQLPKDAAEDSFDQLDVFRGIDTLGPRDHIVYNTKKNEYGIRHKNDVYITARNGYTSIIPSDNFNSKYGYTKDDHQKGQLFDVSTDQAQKTNLIQGNYENVPFAVKEKVTLLKNLFTHVQLTHVPRISPTVSPIALPTSSPSISPTKLSAHWHSSVPTTIPSNGDRTYAPMISASEKGISANSANKLLSELHLMTGLCTIILQLLCG